MVGFGINYHNHAEMANYCAKNTEINGRPIRNFRSDCEASLDELLYKTILEIIEELHLSGKLHGSYMFVTKSCKYPSGG